MAAGHSIPASTFSTISKGKNAITHATSSANASEKNKLKTTPHDMLEEALVTWFEDTRAKNVLLRVEVVQQKALFCAPASGRRLQGKPQLAYYFHCWLLPQCSIIGSPAPRPPQSRCHGSCLDAPPFKHRTYGINDI